eukprot:14452_1
MVDVTLYKQVCIYIAIWATILSIISAYYSYLLFYKAYKNHTAFKTRRPNVLLVYVWSIIIVMLSHCNVSYFFFEKRVSEDFVLAHDIFITLVCTISFSMTRMWFLYYDLRKSRFEQQKLLHQQINSQIQNAPFYIRKSNIFGNTRRVFFTLLTIFVSIFILSVIALSSPQPTRFYFLTMLNFGTILFIFCGTVPLLLWIWCSRRRDRFSDVWKIGMELTLLYITYFISAQVAIFGEIRLGREDPVLLRFFHLIRVRKQDRQDDTLVTMLTLVLNHKTAFYGFLQQLVNDFSVENLTFLIELWQFKYDDENNEVIQSTNNTNLVDVTRSLDWKHLPYGECFTKSNGNRYVMAVLLYDKYFDIHSYDSVNVSGVARGKIQDAIEAIRNNDCVAHASEIVLQIENHDLGTSSPIEVVNGSKDVLAIFDVALCDIFHNLSDVLFRFRSTDAFKDVVGAN